MDVERRRKGRRPVGRAEGAAARIAVEVRVGGFPPSGGNRPSFGGMPGRGGAIGGCGTVVVLLLIVGYYLLSGGQGIDLGSDDRSGHEPGQFRSPAGRAALPESNFTPPVPATASGQTWTVMLYQDADDQVLEQDVYLDLERSRTRRLQQEREHRCTDRPLPRRISRATATGPPPGGTTSRRITTSTRSIRRWCRISARRTCPTARPWWTLSSGPRRTTRPDHYVLILSDHGMGWPGGWSDPAPGGSGRQRCTADRSPRKATST